MRIKAQIRYLFATCTLIFLGTVGWFAVARWREANAPVAYLSEWSPQAAAHYLDQREDHWTHWYSTRRGHGTYCVSCHTQVPYILARPSLQPVVGKNNPTPEEMSMVADITKRIDEGSRVAPYFSDARFGSGKTIQSRSTEAVLNAVILATYDADAGHLSPITRTAFDRAWGYQNSAGGWPWEIFSLAPWESEESAYQGAAWLEIALANTPGDYIHDPHIASHVVLLQHYLQAGYAEQPIMSELYVLWASAKMPQLITSQDRDRLIAQLRELQRPDGGWNLHSIDDPHGENRIDTPQSDGCATGLVVLALEEAGFNPQDAMLEHGLQWLEHHQARDGSWRAFSLNEKRSPISNVGRFMSDAATGYSALALELARQHSTALAEVSP